jgi:hypothetical protein
MSDMNNVNEKFSSLFEDGESLKARVDSPQVWDGDKDWASTQTVQLVPHIDKVNKKLVLPPGISQDARAIVRHEIGHALWSPERLKRGQYTEVRLALEDAIINSRWDALDLGLRASDDMKAMYDEALATNAKDNRIMAVLYAAASIGWQDLDGDPLLDLSPLSTEDRNFIGELRAKIDKYVSVPVKGDDDKGREVLVKAVVQYLKYVDTEEEKKNPSKEAKEDSDIESGAKTQVGGDGSIKNEEALKDKKEHEAKHGDSVPAKVRKPRAKLSSRFKEGLKKAGEAKDSVAYKKLSQLAQRKREVSEVLRTLNAPALNGQLQTYKSTDLAKTITPVGHASGASPDFSNIKNHKNIYTLPAAWGDAEIASPHLINKNPSIRFLGRKDRPTDEGVILRYPEREHTDGKIFGVRNVNKKGGGSIMLDWSGSMSLDSGQVYKLISDAPRKTKVACYSGQSDSGRIIVCADKGRYIDQNTLHQLKKGGGNCIDGPAVAWLTKNAKPRIWISDGHVFGKSRVAPEQRDKIKEMLGAGQFARVVVAPIDEKILGELHATMLKYSIIRCENIFQAMLVLRQHVARTHPMFEDCANPRLNNIGRTRDAGLAWAEFRRDNYTKDWYQKLTEEVARHGEYADW